MEGHPLQPAERIPALQEYFVRSAVQIHPGKSPEEEYQENFKIAQDSFNSLAKSSPNSFDNFKEIMSCGDRIKELMALHKDTKEQKEREYQQGLLEQQIASVYEHLDIFGPELGTWICENWRGRVRHPPSTTTTTTTAAAAAAQSDTVPGAVDTHQPEDTTASSLSPTQDHLAHATSTNDPVPCPPNAENADETTTHPSELHRIEQNTSSGPQKRPMDSQRSLESRPTRPTKRVRSDIAQGPLTGDRTIDFDQVYQNGHAEPKYVIVKHGSFWYILECKKHKLHFNNHPIRGALKHLRGKKHNQTSVNFEEAIRALGTRVLRCTDKNVAENNEVAQRPSYSEMGRPVNSLSPSVAHSLATRSNQNLTEIDPKPGEVYTTYWSETKKFFAILVLPWRNIGHLGKDLSLTVKDTELIRKVPSCYQYNHVDELYEWAPPYRPDGQQYPKRKYPIMYFDASVFPGQCHVSWVAARDFHLYNPQVASTPFKDIVDSYIAAKHSSDQAASHINGGQPTAEIFPREEQFTGVSGREIIVIDDESDDEAGCAEPLLDAPVGTRVPKTEPQEEPMSLCNAQQDASPNPGSGYSQQPLNTALSDHSQHRVDDNVDSHDTLIDSAEYRWRLAQGSQTDSPNPSFPMQPQATTVGDDPVSQWSPTQQHEPIITNFHSHKLPQPTTTETRAPEAIMTQRPHSQNPTDSSQAQATGLYGYLNQAPSELSQCRLDNGRLKWLAPKTTGGI